MTKMRKSSREISLLSICSGDAERTFNIKHDRDV